FLSFLCYLVSWKRGFSLARYLGSWAFLALGMLSKPSVAALPLVILAFEYIYRRDKLDWKLLALRVGPFLALAGAGALYYVFYTSAFTEFLHSSLRIHSLTMATVLAKYIKIFLVPVNLCNSYPPPFFMGTYNYRLAIYLLVDAGLILALVHTLRTGRKALSFGIIFFLLNLLPVSGIMPISIFMADRYLYLSSLGFIFAGLVLLAGLWDSLEVSSRARRWFVAAGATGLIFLACISTVRCRDWKDAITLWGSAVREYPNFQFNHYGLGVALKNAGRPRDALQAFERVNMFREHMMTTCYIGMIMDELGDSARADSLYLRVIQLGERNKQEDAMLAAVYKRLGRMDEAADRWLSLGKMNKHIPYQVKKYARKLLEHGYTSQAGELVAEAADGADPSEGMLTFLVEIMASSGDPRQAGLVIERALSSGEDSLGLLPAMADVQYSLGNRDQALALYSRVPAWSLRPSQLERLAAEYYSRGRLTEALEAFILLRDSNAGRPAASAHNNVGVVLEAMDSLETARAEYLRAVELKPDYADAWFNLGNLARKRRQMEDALGYYRHVRSLEGFSAPVQSAIGAVLIEIGSYTEAFEAFREVLDADSTAPGALLGAADALWLAGRKSEAAACYSRLLELGRQQNLEVPGYARQRAN
ncbi:MAG: tetratricopeptide repeat protein, partial [Gemmatimonadota bacterium]|nr:tetratricopeptide repeat protein [Gemmatimonadota bacterium]